MYDYVIRNGLVYDGKGGDPYEADIAISGNKISDIGQIKDAGKEEINAEDKIVTPGFVDIHTHFDGQVTWDPFLSPSHYHGVTTAVMGNCGVGFAPCKPERHEWLIGLMEGVEDIPGTALAEGIKWNWETFPEFMDAVDQMDLSIDVGLQIPHGALRAYVMDERAAQLEPANDQDIALMSEHVKESLNAGALGFSTSRTEKHRDKDGNNTPTFKAQDKELHGIAKGMSEVDKGVIQLIADFWDFDYEFHMIKEMARISGRPLSLTIEQDYRYPDLWKKTLDGITQANDEGINMKGQVPPRPTGVLQGLSATLNPFIFYPSYQEIKDLSVEEKVSALKNLEFRKRLLSEDVNLDPNNILSLILTHFDKIFIFGESPNYEPTHKESVEYLSKKSGLTPLEFILDYMLEDEGYSLLYMPIMNYVKGNLDDVHYMLNHKYTAFGLGDGGAHCGIMTDYSFPSTLLTHWARDRERGPKIPLEFIIKKQTRDNALYVGLYDRGVLDKNMKADINIIDFDNFKLLKPRIAYDLPLGGKRFIQKTEGMSYSFVSGKIVTKDGIPQGIKEGKLIRGIQGKDDLNFSNVAAE
ncbi:MAG: amidohydrolase family protein [Pseudomonadota bacterium]|nr:amidohydrolase family protein [Pseudomonadota bacterium]